MKIQFIAQITYINMSRTAVYIMSYGHFERATLAHWDTVLFYLFMPM